MGKDFADDAKRVLQMIPQRIAARGLRAVDGSTTVRMALRSLLLWEPRNGHLLLDRLGVDPFELARNLDALLDQQVSEQPAGHADWDFDTLVEPLIRQSIDEASSCKRGIVGVEHLLLAIIRLADPALSALLQDSHIVYNRAREAALELPPGEEEERHQEEMTQLGHHVTKCEIAAEVQTHFDITNSLVDMTSWRTVGDVHRSVVAALGERLESWPGGEPAVWASLRDLLAHGYGVASEAIVEGAHLFEDLELDARDSFRRER
jgi:ATP-dependent Clp protease ATP-binding subunit ClpA